MMNKLHGIIFAYRSNPNLRELSQHRNTCSIPYGGRYRIIDFMLSNLVNAGIHGRSTGYNTPFTLRWKRLCRLSPFCMDARQRDGQQGHEQQTSAKVSFHSHVSSMVLWLNNVHNSRPDEKSPRGESHWPDCLLQKSP